MFFYNYTVAPENWGQVAKKIKDFYFGENTDLTDRNFNDFIRFSTDRMTVRDTVRSVELQAAATRSPVYLYDLSYTGENESTQ